MFRNQSMWFFALAIVLGLVTTVMTYDWLREQTPEPVKAFLKPQGSKIAVASADVPWGTPLTTDMVRLVEYPTAHLPAGHFTDVESLKGRVVLIHLQRHESILETKLAPEDVKHGGILGVMDPDKRAMAVRVNEVVGLPGFIKPGDRVDIMVTLKNPKRGKGKITKTVLENTLVLATGTQMERKGPGEKPTPVKVITFEVSLEEAEKLALASTEGKLRLALRSPRNIEPELTKGATRRSLLSSYRKKRKPSPRARKRLRTQVELIKDGDRSVVKF